MNRALYVLARDIPLGLVLCAGLWGAVHFMLAMLSLFDPSRIPS